MSFNDLYAPKNVPAAAKADDQIKFAPAAGEPAAQPDKTPAVQPAAQPEKAPAGQSAAPKS